MLIGIIAIAGLGALLWGCGGENPSVDNRRRPEREDGGMPQQGRDAITRDAIAADSVSDPVLQAQQSLGNDFNILIHGRRNDRVGCATLSVHAPAWSRMDDHRARLDQQIRWASFPLSSGSSREARLRSGDYRLEEMTGDYQSYATLGLRYFLRAIYDSQNGHLSISLQNVDLQTQNPSGVFLSPLYEGMTSCRANADFFNEFFIAYPSREVDIPLNTSDRQANLCEACRGGIDRISFEIH